MLISFNSEEQLFINEWQSFVVPVTTVHIQSSKNADVTFLLCTGMAAPAGSASSLKGDSNVLLKLLARRTFESADPLWVESCTGFVPVQLVF